MERKTVLAAGDGFVGRKQSAAQSEGTAPHRAIAGEADVTREARVLRLHRFEAYVGGKLHPGVAIAQSRSGK